MVPKLLISSSPLVAQVIDIHLHVESDRPQAFKRAIRAPICTCCGFMRHNFQYFPVCACRCKIWLGLYNTTLIRPLIRLNQPNLPLCYSALSTSRFKSRLQSFTSRGFFPLTYGTFPATSKASTLISALLSFPLDTSIIQALLPQAVHAARPLDLGVARLSLGRSALSRSLRL
jgi:hypothetical protein